MLPTYQPGDTLLGWRWFAPRVGQVVVARVEGEAIIKRITGLTASSVILAGDNPADSRDSRHFGNVPISALEAMILAKI